VSALMALTSQVELGGCSCECIDGVDKLSSEYEKMFWIGRAEKRIL
jgi:hypothetical protein